MAERAPPPLAELHLHLYGCIRAEDYLERVRDLDIDWGWYEREFEQAFGTPPPVREILDRYRDGDADAAHEFKRLFVFGDEDAGSFDRFQAKFNLLLGGSEFRRAERRQTSLQSRTPVSSRAQEAVARQGQISSVYSL